MVYARGVLWFAICILSVTISYGNNNLFLPGDAYFPTVLTEEKLSSLKADRERPPIFEYSSFGGYEGAFCGYAGYQRAAVPGLDEAFITNLKTVYSRIRNYEPKQLVEVKRNGKRVLEETNGMRVLFYPNDFKFPKYRIGLRYNEDWVEEVVKFGHSPRHIRLCCLVDDADAVMESWRDSKSVVGLKVTLPQVELKPVPETTDPVIVQNAVKAIVLDSRPLIEYFWPEEHEMPNVHIVDSSSIRELSFEDGSWKEVNE
ncbi:MAG: hypothetical protein WD468_01970 [Pirellulales bacterium]